MTINIVSADLNFLSLSASTDSIQLLPELDKMIPRFNRYFEPFLGGGAMFFHLIQNRRFTAYLSDTNKELITTYKVVKD
jgi:DNA adenine methylase